MELRLLTDEERRNVWVCGDGTLEAICKAQRDLTKREILEMLEACYFPHNLGETIVCLDNLINSLKEEL